MLTRRQMLTKSLGLTTGLFIPGIAAGLIHRYKTSEGLYRPVLADQLSPFEVIRDMLTHLIVGHSPRPGRFIPGHRWLSRKSRATKFIQRYYIKHHSLPRGKHDLAGLPGYNSPWIVDFDAHLRTIELDISRGNLSGYPGWARAGSGRMAPG